MHTGTNTGTTGGQGIQAGRDPIWAGILVGRDPVGAGIRRAGIRVGRNPAGRNPAGRNRVGRDPGQECAAPRRLLGAPEGTSQRQQVWNSRLSMSGAPESQACSSSDLPRAPVRICPHGRNVKTRSGAQRAPGHPTHMFKSQGHTSPLLCPYPIEDAIVGTQLRSWKERELSPPQMAGSTCPSTPSVLHPLPLGEWPPTARPQSRPSPAHCRGGWDSSRPPSGC